MRQWAFLLGFGCGALALVSTLSGLVLELKRFGEAHRGEGLPLRWGVWVCHTLGLVAFPLAAVALLALYASR